MYLTCQKYMLSLVNYVNSRQYIFSLLKKWNSGYTLLKMCHSEHLWVSQSLVQCWWIQKGQLEEESKTNSCHRYHWPLKLHCSHVTHLLPKQVLKECEISGCCILPIYEWEGGRSDYWYLCWADIWHWLGQAQAYP